MFARRRRVPKEASCRHRCWGIGPVAGDWREFGVQRDGLGGNQPSIWYLDIAANVECILNTCVKTDSGQSRCMMTSSTIGVPGNVSYQDWRQRRSEAASPSAKARVPSAAFARDVPRLRPSRAGMPVDFISKPCRVVDLLRRAPGRRCSVGQRMSVDQSVVEGFTETSGRPVFHRP